MTTPASDTLTPAEAEAMLKRLAKHYNEPVMPIGRYCNALRTWADLLAEAALPGRTPKPERKEYVEFLPHILRDISKSNLLARLLYGGEKLRTLPCPLHKGKWSGIFECEYGCDQTGWIPEPENRPSKDQLQRAIAAIETRRQTQIDKWGRKYESQFDDQQLKALRSTLAYFYPDDPAAGIQAPFTPAHKLFAIVRLGEGREEDCLYFSLRLDLDPRVSAKDGFDIPATTIAEAVKFTEALFDRAHAAEQLMLHASDLAHLLRPSSGYARRGLHLGSGSVYRLSVAETKRLPQVLRTLVAEVGVEKPIENCSITFVEE